MKLNSWEKETNDLSLLDDQFLIALLEQKQRELYARIASLDIEEQPIEYIEGKISDGSINIDGDSSVRRTCSLTMIVNDVDISDVYWGIKTKFRLEIGLKNNLNDEYAPSEESPYPEIVWFPEGTYLITSFSTSITTKGYTISLQGKDKMVMLTGEIGGQIFASTDFGKESISETTFIPIAAGEANSELLMNKTLYLKTEENIEGDYIQANHPDYKFIVTPTGDWVRLEDRFYKLESIVDEYPLQSGYYTKTSRVYLQGLTFIPVEGVNYKYVAKGDYHSFDTPIPSNIPGHRDFPAPTSDDLSGIIIYREDPNNSNKLIPLEFEVYEIKNFSSNRYDAYIIVTEPDQMYELVNLDSETYEANAYYFQKAAINPETKEQLSSQYYVLDTSKTFDGNKIYYKLKELFTLDVEVTIKKLPLERIIREMIHAYALEPYHNIIINDLDSYGLEQLTYKGENPIYVLRSVETGDCVQVALKERNSWLAAAVDNPNFIPDSFIQVSEDNGATKVSGPAITYKGRTITHSGSGTSPQYTVIPIAYGEDIGYRITDLTYTGDLISGIGDSITSILDKIKEMLGEFEYFYDLEGHFVFQQKQTFVNTSWSLIADNDDENYVEYLANDYKKFAFNFEGNRLITAFQNNPNLTNLKNDFTVWGKRSSTSDKDVPIHARYAIDKKPKEYLAFNGILYYTEEATYDPSPEQADKIGSIAESSINESDYHDLTIIPDSLKTIDANNIEHSDWWELSQWAEYYKALTGVYPAQYLKDYGTEGFMGNLTLGRYNINFSGSGQLVIDFDKDSIPNGKQAPTEPLYRRRRYDQKGNPIVEYWSPFQHRYNGCWHWYQQYLGYYSQYDNMIAYIYKPALPTPDIIAKDGGVLKRQPDDAKLVDWRELIYRMAIDYFAGQGCGDGSKPDKNPIYDFKGEMVINNPDHFLSAVAERNPYYYGTGYTGYEQYYTDMQGFWRQLYNPDYAPYLKMGKGKFTTQNVRESVTTAYYQKQKVWEPAKLTEVETEYYVDKTHPKAEAYYNQLQTDANNARAIANENHITEETEEEKLFHQYAKYYISDNEENLKSRVHWNRDVFEFPTKLNFWIDFLDDENELAEYSIPTIGDRSKVVNEDKVGAIYYKEVPGMVLVPGLTEDLEKNGWKCDVSELRDEIQEQSGYTFIYMPKGFDKYFDVSYRKLSAKNKIDQLLYDFAYCIENVSITALPVYHLQPNTRIYVRDDITRINGEYIVKKITLPLKPGGTMNISAVKAPQRLY